MRNNFGRQIYTKTVARKKGDKKRNGWGVVGCAFCSPFPPVHQGTHHPRPPRPLLAALSQDSQHKAKMHQNELFLSEQMHSHSNAQYTYSATQNPLTGIQRERLEAETRAKTHQLLNYALFCSATQRKVTFKNFTPT